MLASISSAARRSFTCSAHASRHSCNSAVLFHPRTFWPKPSSPTSRIDSMTCACGLDCPSFPKSQCTFMSATMPRSTNSFSKKSRASRMPSFCSSSRGNENSTSRASSRSLRFPPPLQQRRAVPLAHLLAEALQPYLAHPQHDMRVWLGLPVLSQVPMHVHVRDHAALDKLLFDKIAGEPDALFLVQLARNRELDFAGELRVLAFLARLDLVP